MTRLCEIYAAFGRLLEYPHAGQEGEVRLLGAALSDVHVDAAESLERFADDVAALSQERREELYTRTFDVMPSCDPYVSSQLFGQESYQRGRLMAGLAAKYEEAGFCCEPELPDHIGVILRFSDGFSSEEWDELVRCGLWTAVSRMSSELRTSGNPYGDLLAAMLPIFEIEAPELTETRPDTPLRVMSMDDMEEAARA